MKSTLQNLKENKQQQQQQKPSLVLKQIKDNLTLIIKTKEKLIMYLNDKWKTEQKYFNKKVSKLRKQFNFCMIYEYLLQRFNLKQKNLDIGSLIHCFRPNGQHWSYYGIND